VEQEIKIELTLGWVLGGFSVGFTQ